MFKYLICCFSVYGVHPRYRNYSFKGCRIERVSQFFAIFIAVCSVSSTSHDYNAIIIHFFNAFLNVFFVFPTHSAFCPTGINHFGASSNKLLDVFKISVAIGYNITIGANTSPTIAIIHGGNSNGSNTRSMRAFKAFSCIGVF